MSGELRISHERRNGTLVFRDASHGQLSASRRTWYPNPTSGDPQYRLTMLDVAGELDGLLARFGKA